ncbi:hypothetical protein RBH26_01435 [Natronolimnohabitans sp. A-GB9]|uniref:DUF7322 domain-containing protein n=1 Tax=Natronolimnohabitans sp. A-GB9 TaxID=3069757 RepID=UPI0027B6A724|nr:hypothetical protein [Natronolimnohabitans sp. A-GB9]MDQ2049137.1 hypothetical protein [Natronolimnohabitans sp. A-GB9]
MDSDRSEDEPDEYDPEAEFRDPESDSITIPEVPTENAGSDLFSDLRSDMESEAEAELATTTETSLSESDVPSDLLEAFWALVLVLNGAILAYALAGLFLVFEGETTYASFLFAAGLVLTGFAVRRYRSVKRQDFSVDDESDEDDASDEGDEGNTPAAGEDDADDNADETDPNRSPD